MGVSQRLYFDYAILKCLNDAAGPLWKKRIYEHINDHIDEFPVLNGIAVQTVGRHVDRLQKAGDLASTIISPEDVNREFMIGFKLTDQGRETLQERRLAVLRANVILAAHPAVDAEEVVQVEKPALIRLMCDEFDLCAGSVEQELVDVPGEDIVAVLAAYYFSKHVRDISTGDGEAVAEIIGAIPAICEEFAADSVLSTLFRTFGDPAIDPPLLEVDDPEPARSEDL